VKNRRHRKGGTRGEEQLKNTQLGTTGLEITRVGLGAGRSGVGAADLELDDDDIELIEGRA
jgi:hypothetical protein